MLSALARPDSPPSDESETRGAPSSPSNSWTSAETAQLPPEPAEESPAEQPKPQMQRVAAWKANRIARAKKSVTDDKQEVAVPNGANPFFVTPADGPNPFMNFEPHEMSKPPGTRAQPLQQEANVANPFF